MRAAARKDGSQALKEAALADYNPADQVWRWHATVAEYANSHFPSSEDERRSGLMALHPAWTRWLERLPAGEGKTLSWLEDTRSNLEVELEVCLKTSYEEAWAFLDALDARLPLPERTLILREIVAKVWEAKLHVLPSDEQAKRASLLNDYGVSLSALGRREEALKPAQEAVDIRRQLAKVNPQAFLPDLASSLGAYGSVLRSLERHDEAAQAFGEGLQHIVPFYREMPRAFAELAQALQKEYLHACQDAGQEPDKVLLNQIVEYKGNY